MTATTPTATSSINAQQLLAEAEQLRQKFSTVNQDIATKPPIEQLDVLQQMTWTEQEQLRLLQNKVEQFFSRVEISPECIEISDKLSEALIILEKLGNIQDQLFLYSDLFTDAQKALQSNQKDALNSLHLRVTCEIGKNHNQGLQNALLGLQSNLREILDVQNPIIITNTAQDIDVERIERLSISAAISTNEQNFTSALRKAAGEVNLANFDGVAHTKAMREAFNTLSDLEKKKFYNEFIKIRKLPEAMLKRSVDLWPGTIKEKLQTAEKAFPSTSAAAPQSNTAKKSDDRVLEKTSGSTQLPQSPGPILQPMASIPTNRDQVSNSLGVFSNVIQPANQMQKGINFLLNNQQGSLAATIQILKEIAKANATCVFATSGNQPVAIDTRPYFHLYHIHRNESPSLLKNDMNYGSKAFAGIDSFTATDTERVRSLQRALVEIYLAGLEGAINFGDSTSMKIFMGLLEDIQLQSSDLPHGTTNVAHALSGIFYQLHTEARYNNPSLTDPNHVQFEGDFGRNAFLSFTTGIDDAIKLQALTQVRNALKAAWRI